MRIRLGKTAYRGVKDDEALIELQEELTQMLEQVSKNGFDTCCAN